MKHLEMQREAAERRRVSLMSTGLARFLERRSRCLDEADDQYTALKTSDATRNDQSDQSTLSKTADSATAHPENSRPKEESSTPPNISSSEPRSSEPQSSADTSGLIKEILDSAARTLRDSLEIEAGGVVFFDTAAGFSEIGWRGAFSDPETEVRERMQVSDDANEQHQRETGGSVKKRPPLSTGADPYNGQVRSSRDGYQAAEVIASSLGRGSGDSETGFRRMDCKTLQTLLNVYEDGNVWYFDEDGYFSSLEQVEQLKMKTDSKASNQQQSNIKRRRSEEIAVATVLLGKFEKARQLIFLPMWDAAAKRWYAGCFVWSHSAVPVFTDDSEIAYLAAFTNSIMVEISRLDAIRADQSKADFIGSISHEFRSPLHGILASTEFLQELTADELQVELLATVQNCGRTLLDTINHVLDFSKINSFEKSNKHEGGSLPSELYSFTNIALLCEEIVDGQIAANCFDDISKTTSDKKVMSHKSTSQIPLRIPDAESTPGEHLVRIILDFEQQDWRFTTQPGALRRIILNIFGNALKYTDKGFIKVTMRSEDRQRAIDKGVKGLDAGKSAVSLIVQDSGRGISSEYLRHRLYTAFAQDDTFAPGAGLGLSIVWSIVHQLGGVISVRSLLRKGTEVEICLPMAQQDQASASDSYEPSSQEFQEADDAMVSLHDMSSKPIIALERFPQTTYSTSGELMILECVEKYLTDWYGFTVTTFEGWSTIPKADVIVALEQYKPPKSVSSFLSDENIPILLLDGTLISKVRKVQRLYENVGYVHQPVGPYKLARHLLARLQQTVPPRSPEQSKPHSNSQSKNSEVREADSQQQVLTIAPNATQPATEDQETKLTHDLKIVHLEDTSSAARHHKHVPSLSDDPMEWLKANVPQYQPRPRPPQAPDNILPTKTDQDVKGHEGLQILAVDDNEINLQLLQRYLSKRKEDKVDNARDGFEAVAAVRNAASQYDIIFMDISMPGMDGFEATKKIRQYEAEQEVCSRSYIVALTGLGAGSDRDKAAKCGFDDYMMKPISFQNVGKLLKKMSSERKP